MSINNITRTNTVDEWRIQTNQAATALNTLETGDYSKTAGTLSVTGAANVILSGTGTGLQVTNTALFSTSVIVGKEISLGAQETATGNLGVGGTTSIYGSGVGLYVANTVVSNGSVIVKNSVIASNVTVNSNVSVIGTANLGYLGVANSGVFGKNVSVGTTLSVTSNATVGNLTSIGRTYTDTLRVEGRSDFGGLVHVQDLATFDTDVSVAGDLSVDGNFTLTGDIVYDTDTFILSSNTPVTAGYAYLGVNRGNTSSTLGTANANAYIRWTETEKIWQIRDVNNADNTTAFSKILTANLISGNLQSVANTTFPSTWVAKDYADNSVIGPYLKANAAFAVANNASNTFNGTTGSATPTGGVITFNSGNGVTVRGTSNTLTINTAQDLQTTASPTFNALTLTNALPITQGGTGAQSAGGALTALLPTGTTAGYVLTTGGPGNFYWAAGGGGGGPGGSAIPGTAINTSRLTYTATAGQTTFTAPAFTAGSGQLKLFINGVRQHADFTETTTTLTTVACTGTAGQFSCASASLAVNQPVIISGALTGTATIAEYFTGKTYYITATNGSTTFTLSESVGGTAITTTAGSVTGISFTTAHRVVLSTGALVNDLVMVEVDGYYVRPYYANNIGFTQTGGIPASANTIQLAMESVESRKANLSGAVFTGGISVIAPTTVDSSTNVPTTSWVKGLLNTAAYTFTASISGNAGTVTNGVYTNGSYADPSWITSIGGGKITKTSTTTYGVVQLSDSLSNTSTSAAATANSVAWLKTTLESAASTLSTNLTNGYQANTGAALISAKAYTNDAASITSGTINMSRLGTTGSPQFGSIGVGTAASGTSGEIRATGDITGYYSDDRLKNKKGNIENALAKLMTLNGFEYEANEIAQALGYTVKPEVGVSAQEVQRILPQVVVPAPIDEQYLTVKYERLVPLLIEAIKELKSEVEELKGQIK